MRSSKSWALAALALLAGCTSGGVSGDGSITGSVKLGGDPAPAGASVVLAGWTSGAGQLDGSGQYSFSKLHDGDYAVMVEVPSTVEQRQMTRVTVAKGAAAKAPDLVFTGVGSISGSVQVAGGGSAAGIPVSADGAGTALTDGSGHFSIKQVSVGAHTVTASIPGQSSASAQVTVAYNQDASAGTLTVGSAAGSLAGTVSIAGATDASGISVQLVGPRSGLVTTGADGSFSFTNLGDGHYLLIARGSDLAPATASLSAEVASGVGPQTLAFTFAPTGKVAGTVQLAGAPLAGAVVMVQGSSLSATTANDGSFILEGVPVGTRTLTYAATGALPATASVTVTRGQSASGSIELQPVTGPATLRSSATLVGGAPAASGTVEMGGISSSIDANGGYALAGLDPQLGALVLHGADPVYQESIPLVLALPGNDGQFLGESTVQPLAPIELQRGLRALSSPCATAYGAAPDGASAVVLASPYCMNQGLSPAVRVPFNSSGAFYRVFEDGRAVPLAPTTSTTFAFAPGSPVLAWSTPNPGFGATLHLSLADGTDAVVSQLLGDTGASAFTFSPDGHALAYATDPASIGDANHRQLELYDLATGAQRVIATDSVEGSVQFAGPRILWVSVNSQGQNVLNASALDGTGAHAVANVALQYATYALDPEGRFLVWIDSADGHLKGTSIDSPSVVTFTGASMLATLPGGGLVVWRDDVTPAEVDVGVLALNASGVLGFTHAPALALPTGVSSSAAALLASGDGQVGLLYTYAWAGGLRALVGANGGVAALPTLANLSWATTLPGPGYNFLTTLPTGTGSGTDVVVDSVAANLTVTSRTIHTVSGVQASSSTGTFIYTDLSNTPVLDDAAGANPISLPAGANSFTFSPDGAHLAFRAGSSGNEYFVLNPPSATPVDLGSIGPDSSAESYFSPDSAHLAFVLDRFVAGGPTVQIAGADGSAPAIAAHQACTFGFSPDGSTLGLGSAFDEANGVFQLGLYNVSSAASAPALGQARGYSGSCGSGETGLWLRGGNFLGSRLMQYGQPYQFQAGAYVLPTP